MPLEEGITCLKSAKMSVILNLRQDFSQPQKAEYAINNEMLAAVENSLVKGGELTATITAQQAAKGLKLTIEVKGKATVECDRCLDDMEVDICSCNELTLLYADHYEDAVDVIYVEQSQKEIDMWPQVYDFIALAVPLQHSHAEGQCNPDMAEKLSQYMVTK